jgi:opacity protein-like surface antigen
MKTRLAVPVLLLVLLALVPAAPAAAFNWGVGADLGYNMFMPSSDYGGDIENISYFGWPLGSQLLFGEVPLSSGGGLRVSFAGEKPTHEAWLGTSLSYFSYSGTSLHMLGLNANYQYNFETSGGVKPYVTAGAGLTRLGYSPESGDGTSAMSATFGGGVGIAHKMGTGRLRAEVRYDQITEGNDDDDDTLILKGGNLGFRLGFDLWSQ